MFKHCLNMNLVIKEVRAWGNSGGILLPREWLGKQVRIELIDRSENIQKEALNILSPHLNDVLGIYLTGSYARGDQEKDSDIDIIVISKKTRKKISSGRYNLEIIPLKSILNLLRNNPLQIYPRIIEAKSILNQGLLDEIKEIKLPSKPWKSYIQECKESIESSNKLLQYDKKDKNPQLTSDSVVYSTILRLRGIYLIRILSSKINYSKEYFQTWIINEASISEEEYKKAYEIYKSIRAGTKEKESITLETAEKLLNLLKKEVKTLEKKKTS